MRQLAFADPAVRRRLEAILHPMIRELAGERCRQAGSPYVILAVPLLVESGTYRERCDRVLVIDCPESLQVSRVMARSGLAETDVRSILATQATRAQRLAAADDVLANDTGLAALERQITGLHRRYLDLAAQKAKAKC
jgi:dephospho-CoA kinase